jgi:hypothetical protein
VTDIGSVRLFSISPIVPSDQNSKKLEKWLQFPPNMTEKHHKTQKLRMEGTGEWFLGGNKFLKWEENEGVLWIEGPCKPWSYS